MKSTLGLLAAGFIAGVLVAAVALAGLNAVGESAQGSSNQDAGEPVAGLAARDTSDAPEAGDDANASSMAALDTDGSGAIEEGRQAPTPSSEEVALLRAELNQLRVRLTSVEQSLSRALSASTSATGAQGETGRASQTPRTQQERRDALVSSGVDPAFADTWLLGEAQRTLDQLALRDQAIREGWIGSERFREEMSAIDAGQAGLLDAIGELSYDRYLYLTGANNRVEVISVLPGSSAETVGLQPGDLIESYADQRVFELGALRQLTTQGEYGELVPVSVKRHGRLLDVWIPRGPLGVTIQPARTDPLR